MQEFPGFPRETVRFLENLRVHNNREWFEAHRQDYINYFQEPAQAFVEIMGAKLRRIAPKVNADPRMNSGSIMRIYKDTRFSKDKRPYRPMLTIIFAEGKRRKNESPGFYFHLECDHVWIGVGMYVFPKGFIQAFRDAVVDPQLGAQLDEALLSIQKAGSYKVGGEKYVRIPRGFDPEHPRANLLLHKNFYVEAPRQDLETVFTPQVVDASFKLYHDMAPLHHWLVAVDLRSEE
jgi:uncharacterized protein (TIGR02453 family)